MFQEMNIYPLFYRLFRLKAHSFNHGLIFQANQIL